MLSTLEFIAQLERLDYNRSGIFERFQVNLNIGEFFTFLKNTDINPIASHDGMLSIVKDSGELTTDYSKQSLNFDFHTDGLYYKNIPPLVILYCANPGYGSTNTLFADSFDIIDQLDDYLTTLQKLGVVYVGRDGTQYFSRLIQQHPRTNEKCLVFGSRAFLRPDIESIPVNNLPSIREICNAGKQLLGAIDTCHKIAHKWQTNDLIVFDNIRYLHARASEGQDTNRELFRIWLSK